ncbi:MAG TPA: hypothetical protein VGM81_04235 [Burkholderiaceae bacterium]|jgi:hypothetical protein
MLVQGRWREAGLGCARLASLHYAALGTGVQLHGLVCTAELDSLQGRTAQANTALDQLVRTPSAPQSWISLIRAESAERRGDPAAGSLFKQALTAEATSTRAPPRPTGGSVRSNGRRRPMWCWPTTAKPPRTPP